jgi:hypothetical protein
MPGNIVLSSRTVDVGFTSPLPSLPQFLRRPREQLLAALIAVIKAKFPALSNTFFTTGDRLLNFGASSLISFIDSEVILRVVQAQTAAISFQASAWKHYVLSTDAPTDVDSISQTIEHVFETVVQFGPEAIDLTGIDPQKVNGEHLAALLRATFTWRDRTPGWQYGLQVARIALERSGGDPRDALIGLM